VDVSPDRAGALVRSVLAICAELAVTVVAEGIETVRRAHAMADMGCPLGQGYLFGQPLPANLLAAPPVPPQPAPARRAHLAS
jgi:EAL domain-containing protein (putative c-di-GMP-specific phosphodiesterase class I)